MLSLLAIIIATLVESFDPKVIVVPDDVASIRKAVELSTWYSEILVKRGVYVEDVFIDKGITIRGERGARLMGHITISRASQVKIKGLSIEVYPFGTGIGILITNSNGVIIENVSLIGSGVQVYNSSNIMIRNSLITESPGPGIRVFGFSKNITIEWSIFNNTYVGLFVSGSSDIVFRYNTVKPRWLCVDLHQNSLNIMIYLNNLLNCSVRDLGTNNYWYHPTMKLGNYWSNHEPVDLNADGISDTQVVFDNNVDPYPLTNPFEDYVNGEKINNFKPGFMLLIPVGAILLIFTGLLIYFVRRKGGKP
ncbi:MAG: NosD domain-containing protein [Candidatus Korarchaeota archaeon]